MKIVTIIKPFNPTFPIFAYRDGELIEERASNMESIADDIAGMAEKYHADQIDIAGPKKFNQGIQKIIEEKGLSKYNLTCQINLV